MHAGLTNQARPTPSLNGNWQCRPGLVCRPGVFISMIDDEIVRRPPTLDAILAETSALGFTMASEPKVGALLAALAASKPAGRLLELGTGTGHGTAWLLLGMDQRSTLDTVDSDAN